MYNIRNGAIQWQISGFQSDGNSNICSMFHHLWDIRKESQVFDFEMKIKIKKWNNLTYAVRLQMLESM